MAFKKVSGQAKYYKYAECTPGQVLVTGVYKGQIEGKFGPQYEFDCETNGHTVLNASGHLDYLIDKNLDVGNRCQVVYQGKETLTTGKFVGKDFHKFDLFVDDEYNKQTTKPKAMINDSAPWSAASEIDLDSIKI